MAKSILSDDLIHEAPCAFLVTDLRGTVSYANKTLSDWLGWELGDLVSVSKLHSLFDPASRLYFETQIFPKILLDGQVKAISCSLQTKDSNSVIPVLLNAKLRKLADQNAGEIHFALFDASERTSFERQLLEAKSEAEELAAIVRHSPDGILRCDSSGRPRRMNPAAVMMMGLESAEPPQKKVSDLIEMTGERKDWFDYALNRLSENAGHVRFETSDDKGRFFEISVAQIDQTENPYASKEYSIILTDISSRVKAQNRLNLLVEELNHRVRNIFANVSGLVRLSLRGDKLKTDRDKLLGRLDSLSNSHNLVTANLWKPTELSELIVPVIAQASDNQQISFDGPDVKVGSNQFKALSMAFHELTTNARKYGALSVSGGQVEITWSLSGSDNRNLHIRWCERGGPPVVTPQRTGFGTIMLKQMLSAEFDGDISMNYARDGLEFDCTGRLRSD